MPVAVRLSRLFYDRFGDEIVNELVELLNLVDSNSRADLREFNELNFSRFDAKLEQRVTELDAKLNAKIDTVYAKLDAKIDRVYTELDAKIDTVYAKLDAKVDRVYTELDAKIDRVYTELNAKIDATSDRILGTMHKEFKEQTRWFLLAWVAQLAALVALAMK